MSDLKQLEQLITTGFTNSDKRFERIEDMLTSLIKIVGATNNKTDTIDQKIDLLNETIISLKDGQERQDRILESLAMGSLEQESNCVN